MAPEPTNLYGGTQTVRVCDICALSLESPVVVSRCGECLGCVDGSRCELPSPVLCPECTELSADHEWAMAQRTPEGFGGESEDES
jgi:hypothetical protein